MEEGDSDEEDGGFANDGTATNSISYNGYEKRDRSLRLEAQFLRTLSCRAGVLGGIAAGLGEKSGRSGTNVDEEGALTRY